MSIMAYQLTSILSQLFAQECDQTDINENAKACAIAPLLGESTSYQWIPIRKRLFPCHAVTMFFLMSMIGIIIVPLRIAMIVRYRYLTLFITLQLTHCGLVTPYGNIKLDKPWHGLLPDGTKSPSYMVGDYAYWRRGEWFALIGACHHHGNAFYGDSAWLGSEEPM